jgi:phage portal protein BeeE
VSTLIRRPRGLLKALTINAEVDPERQSWEGLGSGSGSWGWPRLDGSEGLAHDFSTYVDKAYRDNGIVFACILARQLVFSEARFQYRRRIVGRPGDYFGNGRLGILERPWANGTTGDLLTRMEVDASLAGNFYATTVDDRGRIGRAARGGPGERLARLRPDWVTIVVGVPNQDRPRPHALESKVLAYVYGPPAWAQNRWFGALGDLEEEVTLLPDEVIHYNPIPDPEARFRGMSWLTPVLKEIESDKAATIHKRRFFKGGAMPSMAVSFDKDTSTEEFNEFRESFNEQHGGADNAYKPLFLVGADVRPMTFDMNQLNMKSVQGHIETRIAAAARVPPIIAGLSEGLEASTYSNYAQARRHFADMTMRPLWRMAAGALQPLVDLNDGSELWYDDRDVAFLREDLTAAAEIQAREASTINVLISAGFDPDSVVRAVRTGDFALLRHTGLTSVQLQAPGAQNPQNETNGTVDPVAALAAARNGSAN